MMKRCLTTLTILALAAALSFAVGGCGSACSQLGNKICDCQPTREKQNACTSALKTAKDNYNLSDGQEKQCQEILDAKTCTCEALAAGDLAACGLADDALEGLD